MSRREFLSRGATGIAASSALIASSKASSYSNILGANDTINLAVIGIRGQGGGHIRNYAKMKKIKVTMKEIYDAMKPSVEKNKKKYTRKTKHKNGEGENNK